MATLVLASCRKNKDSVNTLAGTYTGTFQRFGPAYDGGLATVSITFTASSFTGQGPQQPYPAICSGAYTLGNGKIDFDNLCLWTANFDWTLILDGAYDITINGDNVEITRSYNGTIFTQDVYKLVRRP